MESKIELDIQDFKSYEETGKFIYFDFNNIFLE